MPTFYATRVDGQVFAEDAGLGKGVSFQVVQALEAGGMLRRFDVALDDGFSFGLDLLTGEFRVGGEVIPIERPAAPLRLIYYKRKYADVAGGIRPDDAPSKIVEVTEFIAVGWQSTVPGPMGPRNVRFGIKVYPDSNTFELSPDI